MNWNELAEAYSTGARNDAVRMARQKLQQPSESDWQWLRTSLEDEQAKWFVAAVFRGYPVPRRLFEAFLRAAIKETNPSLCRQFVEPCIASFGYRAVNEFLLDVVEGSDNAEIAGAVAALYWANMQISFSGKVPHYTLEYATDNSRAAFLALDDVWRRKRETYLRVFISNEDVTVRRQIIPALNLDEASYPDALKPLVQRAIDLARSHPDEYIRHRVEVQLGNERLLRPIPPRSVQETD